MENGGKVSRKEAIFDHRFILVFGSVEELERCKTAFYNRGSGVTEPLTLLGLAFSVRALVGATSVLQIPEP